MQSEKEENKKYECSECKKRFRKKSDCDRQMRVHTREKPYECYFVTYKLYDTYIPPKAPEKLHKCDECDKSFGWFSLLTKHLASHKKERPFSCDICKKMFKRKYDLNKHIKKVLYIHKTSRIFFRKNTGIMNRDEDLNMNELEHLPELKVFSEVIVQGIELECHICEEKFDDEVAHREHEAKFH
ncbi:adult enhancer factor 1-like [Centruroides vittatus]|uniref:adult enhancer factor 1-like n=1 Tax=Centruroides vittatus TaxID=120091 RepID=UPI0035101CFB